MNINDKKLKTLSYYDNEGAKRVVNAIHVAMADGTLKIIWQGDAYLIVEPTEMWATFDEQIISVSSNTDWIVN